MKYELPKIPQALFDKLIKDLEYIYENLGNDGRISLSYLLHRKIRKIFKVHEIERAKNRLNIVDHII